MTLPHQVAFLLLDDIHHIHHLAPIAFELSQNPRYDCVIFIQTHSQEIVNKIAQLYPADRCQVEVLAPSLWAAIRYSLRQKICRSERLIRYNLPKLLNHDVFISPDLDMDALMMAAKKNGRTCQFCFIPHGAGDRAIPEYANADKIDFMLLCGEKYQRRFIDEHHIAPEKCTIIGYPKFDLTPPAHKPKLFNDDKPVVIYNPHFATDIASWPQWGLHILEYFYQQSALNCIFAPHRNLFNRILHPRILPKKYFNARHIIMDLGSEKSVDMTYTQAADIYLGDISSQVYEFIRVPKPCIFLNAHAVAWQNQPHYLCWQFGAVIDNLADLWNHLSTKPLENPYSHLQKKFFSETFSITEQAAAKRAADAIHHFLSEKNHE
jgi:CDP-glycerol:poly(glycerophosphate) glycerophosphotransferase